jgi:hypothetical protein
VIAEKANEAAIAAIANSKSPTFNNLLFERKLNL